MATFYGVNATKRENQTIKQLIGPGDVAGRVRVARDTFELSADLAAADTIRMMELPEGARVLDAILFFDDLDAAGGTLDVGWEAGAGAVEAADADGFLSAVDVTSAGLTTMQDDQPTRPGFDKLFSEAVQVAVTVLGDTDATSGTITLYLYYVVD